MGGILEKISSYNIFNYLLPGVIFAASVNQFSSYSIIQDDTIIGLFLYYFIGLVISRFGSLLLEPLLKKVGFLTYVQYSAFVEVSKTDQKLETLSEINNMYRTFVALFICLMIFMVLDAVVGWYPIVGAWLPWLSIAALFTLFLYSWKKQISYIVSRVEAAGKD